MEVVVPEKFKYKLLFSLPFEWYYDRNNRQQSPNLRSQKSNVESKYEQMFGFIVLCRLILFILYTYNTEIISTKAPFTRAICKKLASLLKTR
jgi:hypothetical protein